MLRLRLATLALASGVLFTLSGCCSFCENGQFRLFPSRSSGYGAFSHPTAECECHNAFMAPPPAMMSSAQGPVMTMPSTASATTPIPITNIPATTQPPSIFRVPSAPPTAYVPN
jgi:hypothetical protein